MLIFEATFLILCRRFFYLKYGMIGYQKNALIFLFAFLFCLSIGKGGKLYSQCNTISNLSFSTSSINTCALPQTLNFYPQSKIDQTPILLNTYTVGFTSKQDKDFTMANNGCVYVLKVTGSFTLWGNSNDYLDAYSKFGFSGNGFQYIDATLMDCFSLSPDSGPTAYNPAHEYYFYFTGNASNLNFKFTDSPYNDNAGSVTFEWSVIPCYSYLWDFGGGNVSTDSIGTHTFSSSGTSVVSYTVTDEVNNCSESYSMPIVMSAVSTNNLIGEICTGESYKVGNSIYTQSGNYIDTLASQNGCDSIVNLSLSVLNATTVYIDTVLCSGQKYVLGNNSYTQSGNYIDTISAIIGCDSIINLTLTIASPALIYIDTIMCKGSSYILGGNTYNTSGSYTHTFNSVMGCDSIVNLDLTISDSIITTLEQTLCAGESYMLGSNTYSTSGVYSETFLSGSGCDSIVKLYLTIHDASIVDITASICQGDVKEIGNNIYSQTGNYSDTLQGINSCDSIINLSLTVNDTAVSYKYISLCEGEAYFVGSNMYTGTGDYTDVFSNIHGCDSVIITYLTVSPQPNPELGDTLSLCSNEPLTLSPGIFSSYLWNNESADSSITINETGIYYVTVTDSNLCSSTDSIEIYEGECTTIYVPNTFTPNRDGLNDYFNAMGEHITEYNLHVFDYWGHLIYETNIYNSMQNEANGWDGQNAPEGSYVWHIEYKYSKGNGYFSKKSMRGVVSLIR